MPAFICESNFNNSRETKASSSLLVLIFFSRIKSNILFLLTIIA
jgi:hypothetical protein